MSQKKFLTPKEVMQTIEYGRTKFYQMIKDNDFPKGEKATPNSHTRWRTEVVNKWLESRKTAAY